MVEARTLRDRPRLSMPRRGEPQNCRERASFRHDPIRRAWGDRALVLLILPDVPALPRSFAGILNTGDRNVAAPCPR